MDSWYRLISLLYLNSLRKNNRPNIITLQQWKRRVSVTFACSVATYGNWLNRARASISHPSVKNRRTVGATWRSHQRQSSKSKSFITKETKDIPPPPLPLPLTSPFALPPPLSLSLSLSLSLLSFVFFLLYSWENIWIIESADKWGFFAGQRSRSRWERIPADLKESSRISKHGARFSIIKSIQLITWSLEPQTFLIAYQFQETPSAQDPKNPHLQDRRESGVGVKGGRWPFERDWGLDA